MKYSRIIGIFFACLAALLLTSCFGSDFSEVRISAAQTPDSTAKAIYETIPFDIDENLLKDYVLGDPAFIATPSAFIMDINSIDLFNPTDANDLSKGAIQSYWLLDVDRFNDHWIIPKRYNMLTAKGIATLELPLSLLRRDWHGFSISIRPGGNEETNGMWAGTVIGIRKDSLPAGITEDMIVNKMMVFPFGIEYPDDSIWFSFQDILPFKGNGMLSILIFSDSVTSATMINPEGVDADWQCGSRQSRRSNQTVMVLPMQTIKLSNLILPELIIALDTENLLEFYPDGSGKYLASLSKNNPFPFRIYIDEYDPSVYLYTEQMITDIKDAAPFDCFDYKMTTSKGFMHILTHTQPNYSGIDYVEVFRSQKDVFDESAQLIYRGTKLSVIDDKPAKDEEVYYYIRSVDLLGAKSDPVQFFGIETSFLL